MALLDFVRVSGADVETTPVGECFASAEIQVSKCISTQRARTRARLVRTICHASRDCSDRSLRAGFFLDMLQQGLNPRDAQQQHDIAIGWGQYAELFDYNTNTELTTAETDAEIPGPTLTEARNLESKE